VNDPVPASEVTWRLVRYLKIHEDGPEDQHPWEFELVLPEPLASWDVFAIWEVERTRSMRDNLKRGDVLFDIGAEHGWLSAVYARFTGAENLVLFEPTPEFWPNIMSTFEHNGLPTPKACVWALVGSENGTLPSIALNDWPEEAKTGRLIPKLAYRYIHNEDDLAEVPMITIDTFVKQTGIVPDALSADTEGAEILIIRGAEQTLRQHHPIVWLSIHPDLALRDGYGDVQNVHDFMAGLGYMGTYLATDHEEHWVFTHPDGRQLRLSPEGL
jgi:FkbM family methyltransferase